MATFLQKVTQKTTDHGGGSIKKAALFVFAALVLLLFWAFPTPETSMVAGLERTSFDRQIGFLREYFPRDAPVEPVLIGVDEATEAEFPEPRALWHRHLADLFDALVIARPAVVGVDIVLPTKAYEDNLPGGQLDLIKSLYRVSQNMPTVFVNTIEVFEGRRRMKEVHPGFLRFMRPGNFGIDQVLYDPDLVARRFSERDLGSGKPSADGEAVLGSFAGQIARLLGKPVGEGYIDFSRGEPLTYVPMQQVIGWLKADNRAELQRHFAGRVVLVGSVQNDEDRWKLPAMMTRFDQLDAKQSGVVVHLQTLRSLLGDGLIRPLPQAVLTLLCPLLLCCVWIRSSKHLFVRMFLVAPILLSVSSILLLANNWYLPAVTIIATLWIAIVVRAIADALESAVEKNRLKQSFSGSVSPAVLQEMLAGNLSPGVSGQTAEVCVLFSDIRNFTGLSESLTPEKVTELLTRYFDRMVTAVHHHDGTIDKFIGDGMMVLFGAPRALPDACGSSVKCAWEMMRSLDALNAELAVEGLPPLRIGIGINYGKVVVGNIGSTERHNYSAIGDAVNVASRLEGLTKRLATPIVMTETVKVRLGAGFGLIAFGEQVLRGHSPLHVWGVAGVPASTIDR